MCQLELCANIGVDLLDSEADEKYLTQQCNVLHPPNKPLCDLGGGLPGSLESQISPLEAEFISRLIQLYDVDTYCDTDPPKLCLLQDSGGHHILFVRARATRIELARKRRHPEPELSVVLELCVHLSDSGANTYYTQVLSPSKELKPIVSKLVEHCR